jgi:hypothetical protein
VRARRLFACAVFVALSAPGAGSAHVGSPEVTAAGSAGPYDLSVMIRPPASAPGLASVEVAAADDALRELRVQAASIGSPSTASPVVARRTSANGRASFAAEAWLASPGPWRFELRAAGARGDGALSVVVPPRRRVGGRLRALLLALKIGLALGAAVVMGGKATKLRHAKTWTALAVVGFVGLALALGRAPAAECSPGALEASVASDQLSLRLPDAPLGCGGRGSALLPDHGHLMHLFLVRVPGLDRILHLHPRPAGDGRFVQDLPELSAGRYQAFADIVDAAGAPLTVQGDLTLPSSSGRAPSGDDAVGTAPSIEAADPARTIAVLSDGARLIWRRDEAPLRSGRLVSLTFVVEDARGAAVGDLQPYMGMLGHAVVLRHDRAVFAHIHPTGSVPMAASAALAGQSPAPDHQCATPTEASSVTFPYAFPTPGRYRVFVQIKRNDRVETATFDAAVAG